MRVKIKSFNGELPEYLTNGKVYSCLKDRESGHVYISDDDGDVIRDVLDKSYYLNGGSWEVVGEN